jgi:hypothetical protein
MEVSRSLSLCTIWLMQKLSTASVRSAATLLRPYSCWTGMPRTRTVRPEGRRKTPALWADSVAPYTVRRRCTYSRRAGPRPNGAPFGLSVAVRFQYVNKPNVWRRADPRFQVSSAPAARIRRRSRT